MSIARYWWVDIFSSRKLGPDPVEVSVTFFFFLKMCIPQLWPICWKIILTLSSSFFYFNSMWNCSFLPPYSLTNFTEKLRRENLVKCLLEIQAAYTEIYLTNMNILGTWKYVPHKCLYYGNWLVSYMKCSSKEVWEQIK